MAFSISFSSTPKTNLCSTQIHKHPFLSFPVSISVSNQNFTEFSRHLCLAAKSQAGPVKKRSSSAANKKKKKKKKDRNDNDNENSLEELSLSDVEIVDDEYESSNSRSLSYNPTPLPNPPAGFVVDDTGRVVMASNKRIATIVDSINNNPLECVIRRVFSSSKGDECMLLCPVDTPVQILKSMNIDGWSAGIGINILQMLSHGLVSSSLFYAMVFEKTYIELDLLDITEVSDEEVEAILPTAAYALAKIHMHLVHSGFCYTARGGFCYSEDDIFDFRTDDGQDVDGLPTEGIEITCFHLDGSHYMIYTPSDPLLFVAVKDGNGQLQIADDDLLEDPAVISAIDEETEFNALVEEEAALLESLLGKER